MAQERHMISELPVAPEPIIPDTDPLPVPLDLPLAERLAAVPLAERTALLLAAIATGEVLTLPGADLRGVDLRPGRPARGDGAAGLALVPSTVNLDGANLAGATLSGACLAHTSLRGACLDEALLVGADLRGADLAGATLRKANLSGADLTRADLSFASLRGASLLTANLTEVTATGADLRETILHAAALPRVILRAADLRWAHLDAANLTGAALDGARFEGATLALANLAGARLSQATDFSYAFLHQARLDRTGLRRAHLGGGIGEAYADRLLARGTYRALEQLFEAEGLVADARWAHVQSLRMCTASHRPDRCLHYHGRGLGRAGPGRRTLFYARHTWLWGAGSVAGLTTGFGTSAARVLLTLILTWLVAALMYGAMGGLVNVLGVPTHPVDMLAYSAAALTPIDAYPVVAVGGAARTLAVVEGALGITLLGALGYVLLARLRT
jgi:uncharacterized protein YjbI with pentapeptide repeats